MTATVSKASPEFMKSLAGAGRLATGLTSRTAPHSARAAADSQKRLKAELKGEQPAKAAKPAKAKAPAKEKAKAASTAAKARTEAKKAVRKDLKIGANRAYKVLVPVKDLVARPDSWRYAMLAAICGAKDTDGAKALIAKNREFKDRKLDFSWAAAQKYIQFTN